MKVAIVLGSKSDIGLIDKGESLLKDFNIPYETIILSAHRNPNKIRKFAISAEKNGIDIIIACAGLAAHLPGVIASLTTIPVIGVPVESGPLHGQDALYSIVQMPFGIPVATVGINNVANAVLLATQILVLKYPALRDIVIEYRKRFGDDEN